MGCTYPLFLAMEPHQPRTSLSTTRVRSCRRKGEGSPWGGTSRWPRLEHLSHQERNFKAFPMEDPVKDTGRRMLDGGEDSALRFTLGLAVS